MRAGINTITINVPIKTIALLRSMYEKIQVLCDNFKLNILSLFEDTSSLNTWLA